VKTITCPHCKFAENPAGFRYCGNCGRALQDPFPKVPPFISSPSYHPSQALSTEAFEQFQAAAQQARGERRNVVVLFADLCDYTLFSHQMDPEDVFSVINRYLGVLIEQVYKYEGIIDKFTGDGIMAIFGAPIAHENDAERAVRATIEMQNELRHLNVEMAGETGKVRVRLGLHYGAVIFGQVGINLDDAVSVMDYTAIGDIVNIASRLEEAAEPGSTLVSQAIYERTQALIEYEPVPPLTLKGVGEPVPAYCVVGLKARPGRVRGLEGRQTLLIGREKEMDIVSRAAQNLRPGGPGRILLVIGEGGIGKSRLTAELKKKVSASDVAILEGSSLSYRRSVSYWTFRELLHSYFDFQADDTYTERQQKIRQRLAALGDDLQDAAPLLELVLSIKTADTEVARRLQQLEAEQLRQQTFVAIRDLFLAEAKRRPLMLILEDLHWADRLTLELVKFLMDIAPQVPLLLYCISRPLEGGSAELLAEYAQSRFPEFYTAVTLQPLSAAQSNELLNALLAIPSLPAALHTIISERAEGNPFFLEETIRMLIGEGIIHQVGRHWELAPGAQFAQLDVPDTLQGLVLARSDRLPEKQRELLQSASVIGFRFSLRLLSAVTPQSDLEEQLGILKARDFIIRQADGTDPTYTFRHVITSETIYRSILRQRRSVIHGQVAQAIERLYRDRLDEQVEALATHYARSHCQDRALYYLIRAGQKTARSFANTEALSYYEQALNLLEQVDSAPQQRLDVLEGMGDVLTFIARYAEARPLYQQAVEFLGVRAGKAHNCQIGALKRKIADTYTKQGDYDQALTYLTAALRQVQADTSPTAGEEKARICGDIGWVYLRRGNFERANAWLQQGLELVDDSIHRPLAASIYNRLGGVAYQDGDWEEAARWLGQSLEIQQQLGDLAGMARSHNNLGVMAASHGELEKARRNLARSLELRTRIGDTEGVLSNNTNLGAVLITLGELDEAERVLHQALEIAERIGSSFSEGIAHLNLGRLWTSVEEWERAIQHLESSAAILGEIGAQDDLIDACYFLGEACLGLGELDRAERWAKQALDLAAQLGSRTLSKSFERGRCVRLLGALARERRDWKKADELLRESVAIYDALGNQLEQGKSYYELAMLFSAQGDHPSAVEYLTQARDTFRHLGAPLEEKKAEKALRISRGDDQ